MDQPGHRAHAIFTQRVVSLTSRKRSFVNGGDDRAADGLVGIVPGNQAHIVGSDAQRQHRFRAGERRALILGQGNHRFQLANTADTVAGLPPPVVPQLSGNAGKMSLAERSDSRAEDSGTLGGKPDESPGGFSGGNGRGCFQTSTRVGGVVVTFLSCLRRCCDQLFVPFRGELHGVGFPLLKRLSLFRSLAIGNRGFVPNSIRFRWPRINVFLAQMQAKKEHPEIFFNHNISICYNYIAHGLVVGWFFLSHNSVSGEP